MRRVALAALFLALPAVPAHSEALPKAGSLDNRVTYATYQEGQVYRIATRLKTVTLVELGDGERIQSIAIGDLESFKVDRLERSNIFIVKPVIPGASTNLTVETARHLYFLEVHETSRGKPAYSVKFTLPEARRNRSAAADIPAATPMTYRVLKKGSGKKRPAFTPTRISDDGRKTYFDIPADAPMPTVFRADEKGREYSVNTSVRGTRITVSTRSERWVLRYGDTYVCVSGS